MPGGKYSCAKCRGRFEIPHISDADKTIVCPLCGELTQLVPAKGGGKANHESRNEFNALGCTLLFGGLISICFAFPWGLAGGLPLIVIGSRLTRVNICSKCDAKIPDRTAKTCPNCHAVFADEAI